MFDAVLVAMHARRDHARRLGWGVGIDQVNLVGLVIVHVDEDELRRLRLRDADVEADVGLSMHQHVVRHRRADGVAIDE